MSSKNYSKENEKKFLLIISIIFILLTIFVVFDILAVLIYSVLISYLLFPLYNFYLKKFGDRRISSLVTLITATIVLAVPFALLSYFLILNLVKILVQYRLYIENPDIFNSVIANFLEKFTDSSVLSSVNFSDFFNNFVIFVVDLTRNFFSSLPIMLIYFFIMVFITYYILIHNKKILTTLNEYIPLSLRKQNEIVKNITANLRVLFRGYFLTGLIQTAVATLGYILFGAPNILILAFLTLLVSLIPYLGSPLVWIPISLYMILIGDQFNGVALFIYGTFIISTIDNFLRPVLMSDKDTISPPLVFIGFVGGLIAFGISGIILGPLIISITSILLKYLKEYYETKT